MRGTLGSICIRCHTNTLLSLMLATHLWAATTKIGVEFVNGPPQPALKTLRIHSATSQLAAGTDRMSMIDLLVSLSLPQPQLLLPLPQQLRQVPFSDPTTTTTTAA